MSDLIGIPDSQPITAEDQPSSLLSVTAILRLGLWEPSHIMVEMLKQRASLGDVQTSASVLLALGDRRRSLTTLDEATQEHWLLGYLDTLARYRLWEVGTQVSFQSELVHAVILIPPQNVYEWMLSNFLLSFTCELRILTPLLNRLLLSLIDL